MTFKELNLRAELISAVEELGYEQPMPVQEQTIPFMLTQTADLVALAQTGTGKTAAFGLPILNMVDVKFNQVQALVLAPTRELCIQISNDMKGYSRHMPGMHIVPVYGGEDIRKQLKELDRTPQIVVATPGRLIDLIERGKIKLQNISYLVLDEADEMLNLGFKEDIETIDASNLESTRNRMMGLEGTAGRYYFNCLSTVMPEKFKFDGRSRRPAQDPFNACLNYCYGILYGLVEKSLHPLRTGSLCRISAHGQL